MKTNSFSDGVATVYWEGRNDDVQQPRSEESNAWGCVQASGHGRKQITQGTGQFAKTLLAARKLNLFVGPGSGAGIRSARGRRGQVQKELIQLKKRAPSIESMN